MDDKNAKGTPEGRNIIDLDAAREEKRRAERAEEKRMARSARPSLRRRMLSLFSGACSGFGRSAGDGILGRYQF